MAVSVTMPRLGESVSEGTVTRWLKAEGEHVDADEPLLEVSTDKVDTEIPSPASGVLSSIKVAEDETVDVGTELAVIDDGPAAAEPAAPAAEATPAAEAAPAEAAPAASAPAPAAAAAPPASPPPFVAAPSPTPRLPQLPRSHRLPPRRQQRNRPHQHPSLQPQSLQHPSLQPQSRSPKRLRPLTLPTTTPVRDRRTSPRWFAGSRPSTTSISPPSPALVWAGGSASRT